MRKFLLALSLISTSTFAQDVAQYMCTIGGVYENVSGRLVQRPTDKAIGQQIYVNADTGEVTGYFGTDDFSITKLKRPEGDGLLTIETSSGILGDAANRLIVSAVDEQAKNFAFVYTKNWLIISGLCSPVVRRR